MNKWHMLCFCDAAGRREERRSGTQGFRILGEDMKDYCPNNTKIGGLLRKKDYCMKSKIQDLTRQK